MTPDTPLPIDDALPELRAALAAGPSAVLVAPPGAGKTTRVPLALMDEPWLAGRRIIVLEPRRIAARTAAERMAATLGERLGNRIGLRARLATQTGPRARIEVVTEGVFTRMIVDDPALDGIGAVLLDEFHERSLDADLALALTLEARSALRPDLRLLVMSATLETGPIAERLGGAPIIRSEGRAFPVETRYLGRDRTRSVEDAMADAISTALRRETGSILAFLPGQAEIRRVERRLADRGLPDDTDVTPLHGGLAPGAQDKAIQPAVAGRRKVVLATSIAETSLTIEGVRVVIDCGLSRVPRYEPDVGVTRLETVRVSRASADQRRGRAGRTQPGVCYRLWAEPETASLMPFAAPEIRAADLAGLLLDCAAFGESDPSRLPWLEPPPAAAIEAAREELRLLGALDADEHITPAGQELRALPLPPRLARMVREAALLGEAAAATEIAAVIVERGLGGNDTDLAQRLQVLRHDRSPRAANMRRLASGWAQQAAKDARPRRSGGTISAAALLALAYPERIAKARGEPGRYVLANGRGGVLDAADPLARSPYLVVADMSGRAESTRILLAATLDEAEVMRIAADRITETDEITFDQRSQALRARRVHRLDAIVLSSDPLTVPAGEGALAALLAGIGACGIDALPWSKAQRQLRQRIAFLRSHDAASAQSLPDLSDAALTAALGDWLGPFLHGKTRLADIGPDDLGSALDVLVPFRMRQHIDAAAPSHYEAPTGNRVPISYDGPGAPSIAIRVQELFGLTTHPAIAEGRLPLTLDLLSPAQRTIQITRDLPGFWRGSWMSVRADMRGRYPRHPWPENPAEAVATARAKPRGT